MNQVTTYSPTAAWNGHQLALIKRTVAKDTNEDEFNLFVTVARAKGLDPFSRQIMALVFNKTNKDKRQMCIVTGIDGMRAIAARSKRYRPDEDEPEYTYNPELKDPRTNPLGIEKARVNIYIEDAMIPGEWKRVAGVAYWDEFAPITEEWGEDETGQRRPNGKRKLDGQWSKMGRLMIAKCAEAQALRRAFPEDLSNLYEGAELDRSIAMEMSASEVIAQTQAENRLKMIGASNAITFQMTMAGALEHIPLGQIFDRVAAEAKDWDLNQLDRFMAINERSLNEYWARAKSDALELKRNLEALRARLVKAAQDAEKAQDAEVEAVS